MAAARPGTQKISFTGLVAVPDDFQRLRLLLTTHEKIEMCKQHMNLPITAIERSTDQFQYIVIVVIPKRYRQYWLGIAQELRGQLAAIETTVRRTHLGMSLDLVSIAIF